MVPLRVLVSILSRLACGALDAGLTHDLDKLLKVSGGKDLLLTMRAARSSSLFNHR